MIRFCLLALLMSLPALAQRVPDPESGLEDGVEVRLLKRYRRYVFSLEAKSRNDIIEENYRQLLVGSYYRITKRWRMGLFAQAEQGLRWDEDWHRGSGLWGWKPSDSRWDFSSVLDSTYTDHLTGRLLYEIKTRFYYYHSRDALQFRLRPGLRYFVMREGRPLWQLYTAAEAYAPLNYGEGPLYEFWLYAGALYQLTPEFSVGPLLAYRQRWFRSYDSFEDRTGEDFERTFKSTYIGLTAVYSW